MTSCSGPWREAAPEPDAAFQGAAYAGVVSDGDGNTDIRHLAAAATGFP